MIIGNKTTGWPVPGVQFDGRQVFIEAKPGDQAEMLGKLAAMVCLSLKLFADLRAAPGTNHHQLEVVRRWMKIWDETGIRISHNVEPNYNQLLRKNLDG